MIIKPIKDGYQILQEIPTIELYQLNNMLLNYPLFIGLEFTDNKLYGIVSEIKI